MRTKTIYRSKELTLTRSKDQRSDPANFRLHTHENAEIYYFLEGKGTFHIEGTAYPLEPGDLLVMAPQEAHCITVDCDRPYERMVLNVETEFLQGIDPQGELLKPILERKIGTRNLYKAYEFAAGSCEEYFRQMQSTKGQPRLNVLCGMLALLNAIYQMDTGKEQAEEVDAPLPRRIVSYINQNISQPISLEDVCRQFYISRSQLCRLFKQVTGTTVWHYITVKRMEKAKKLLEAGENPTKIYEKCGYTDYSSFYRAYRKHFGVGPKDCR